MEIKCCQISKKKALCCGPNFFSLRNYFKCLWLYDSIVAAVFTKFIKNVWTKKTVVEIFTFYLQSKCGISE